MTHCALTFVTPHPLRGASLLPHGRRLVFISGGCSGTLSPLGERGQGLKKLSRLHSTDQLGQRVLRVTKEHDRLGVVHEVVVDPSEPRPHRALHEDDVLSLV